MKKSGVFLSLYAIFVMVMVILVSVNSKADLQLWMTSHNSSFADTFFHYYTFVGDWIPFAVAGILLFWSFRAAGFIVVSQLVSGLFSSLIKTLWNEPRPLLYFKEHFPSVQLHTVAGEHINMWHSFPSGHTITAFAFFLALTFFTKNHAWQVLYFVLAVLVGFSRIYLQQHFAIDVLVGSLVGVLVTMGCKFMLDKFPIKWIDNSFFSLLKK
ncbi:MAG: phosphatase PAP2 family protein [Paludibacter sp.]|jgi:membrane-associated phospholipid phosphatase